MTRDEKLAALRDEIAAACRIVAHRGLADGILGHISLRIDDNHMLVRSRGPRECGLAYTEADDIQLVTFDGSGAEEGYSVPNELPIHAAVLGARPDVHSVVHVHPPGVVAADLAGMGILPIVGAYDIPGARLAAEGIPVYPRGVLIRTAELGNAMVEAMGDRPVVILRGHGLTSTGASVAEAVLRAISVERLAQLSITIAAAGGTPKSLPPEDLAELPDLGGSFNLDTAWRHELARIGHHQPGA